ncbi:MAG: hypothetical protein KME06_06400 [Kastovskya adunca ATA6-11-RM4]|nr:hypothetical protein [Kastovskya adunca ATA6-11-RM4]
MPPELPCPQGLYKWFLALPAKRARSRLFSPSVGGHLPTQTKISWILNQQGE